MLHGAHPGDPLSWTKTSLAHPQLRDGFHAPLCCVAGAESQFCKPRPQHRCRVPRTRSLTHRSLAGGSGALLGSSAEGPWLSGPCSPCPVQPPPCTESGLSVGHAAADGVHEHHASALGPVLPESSLSEPRGHAGRGSRLDRWVTGGRVARSPAEEELAAEGPAPARPEARGVQPLSPVVPQKSGERHCSEPRVSGRVPNR